MIANGYDIVTIYFVFKSQNCTIFKVQFLYKIGDEIPVYSDKRNPTEGPL